MNKYYMTCNCYEPLFREEMMVKAVNMDEAWDKAKKKAAKKYKANVADIEITATRCEKQ